jgi:hypothetical protein
MSDEKTPPAPDASQRLSFPPPVPPASEAIAIKDAKNQKDPKVSITAIKVQANKPALRPINHVLALVLGIVSFILGFMPFLGFTLALISLVIAIVGFRTNKSKKNFFVWALVLSGVATAAGIAWTTGFLVSRYH